MSEGDVYADSRGLHDRFPVIVPCLTQTGLDIMPQNSYSAEWTRKTPDFERSLV